MTGLYIGVDGGGTFCRARLVNGEGTVLGEASRAPVIHVLVLKPRGKI